MKFALVSLLVSVLMLIVVEGWGNRRKLSRKNTTSTHPRKRWCCKGNKTCQPLDPLYSSSSRAVRSCFQHCKLCLRLCSAST
uniref:Uncharacterized protein n=1 Tax=Rhipicephalus zambeziensis TaxID=60191 RepID=A0A224YIM4_9ACAR